MSKLLLFLMLVLSSLNLYSQKFKIVDRVLLPLVYENKGDTIMYQKVNSLDRLVFNMASNFQMLQGRDVAKNGVQKPSVIVDDKPFPIDSVKNIPMQNVKNIEIWHGVKANALYGVSSQRGLIMIETKRKALD